MNTLACLFCLPHESHLEESAGRGRPAWVWLAQHCWAGRAGCGFPSTLEVREEALSRRGRAARRGAGRARVTGRAGRRASTAGLGSSGAASRRQRLRSAAGRRLRPGQRRAAPAGECARAGAGAGAAAARAERPPPSPRGPTGLAASPPLPASLALLCVSGSLPLRKPLS